MGPFRAYFCLAGSMALVGANIAIGKLVIAELPIFLFSAFRFVIACVALAPLTLIESGPGLSALSVRDWRDLFLQSLFGVFLFTLLMLSGVALAPASSAGIITGTLPAVIALLGWRLFGEHLGWRACLGIALSGAAILVLAVGGHESGAATPAGGYAELGMLLVFGAVISEALFTIFAKRLSSRITPLRMAFCVNLIGLLLFTPLALWHSADFDPTQVSAEIWGLAVYYALTASVLSFVLWYLGIRHVPASRAGIFTAVLPLSATLVSVTFLGEHAGLAVLAGTACVMAAIWFGTVDR